MKAILNGGEFDGSEFNVERYPEILSMPLTTSDSESQDYHPFGIVLDAKEFHQLNFCRRHIFSLDYICESCNEAHYRFIYTQK